MPARREPGSPGTRPQCPGFFLSGTNASQLHSALSAAEAGAPLAACPKLPSAPLHVTAHCLATASPQHVSRAESLARPPFLIHILPLGPTLLFRHWLLPSLLPTNRRPCVAPLPFLLPRPILTASAYAREMNCGPPATCSSFDWRLCASLHIRATGTGLPTSYPLIDTADSDTFAVLD